jgi:CPA1 family monovalent cation:H+ antiporter
MVLTLPLTTAAGAPFPGRQTIIAAAFGVVLATLLVQGLTLRPLIWALAVPPDDVLRRVEHELRETAREAVIQLRDDETIGLEAMRRIQADLDLEELRNIDEPR